MSSGSDLGLNRYSPDTETDSDDHCPIPHRPTPRRPPRMDRARRARPRLPALRDGPDRAAPRGAVASASDLQPTSAQLLWIIDIYGFMVAGLPDHHGHARRPDRPPQAAAHRRGRVRRRFAARRVLDERRRCSSPSRALLGIAGATLAPSTLSLIFSMFQDPRQRSVAIGVWISASRPAARSARCSAACCWSTSGGARCSCWRCR